MKLSGQGRSLTSFPRAFAGLAIVLVLSAVFSNPAHPQSLPHFRIANGTSGENPAVLWVGVDRGFYRKHGLNVEVIFMRSGPLAMSALASSDVQMVFTSSNNVLNVAAGGLDVVIIANVVGRLEGDFMTRPEIKKAEELKGKQVAIQSIGGGGWANNMLAMDYFGLDPDRDNIRFLVLGDQPSRIQALEAGRASFMDGLDLQRSAKEKRLHGFARNGPRADSLLGRIARRAKERVSRRPEAIRSDAERHHRRHALLHEAGK